jgi:hypothetical protein
MDPMVVWVLRATSCCSPHLNTQYSMEEWKHPTSPIKMMFKYQPHCSHSSRIPQGPIFEHYQERGVMIKSAFCNEILHNKLKPATWSKNWAQLSEGVVLLHNSAHPHTAATLPKQSSTYDSDHRTSIIHPLPCYIRFLSTWTLKTALRSHQFDRK